MATADSATIAAPEIANRKSQARHCRPGTQALEFVAVTVQPDIAATSRAALAEALIRVGGGERAALAEVYSRTSAKLFGICLRICGERQAAEDVLQEVYLTVWKRAAGYEPGRASPITWLATIARNRAIDWRRAQGARIMAPVDEIEPIADSAPLASDAMVVAEDMNRLHLCLGALEEPQRAAIRAAFFNGSTYADLAEHSGVPLGTVKSRIRRGLLRLKECLHRDG